MYPQEFMDDEELTEYDYAILRVDTDTNGNHIGDRAGTLSWREAGTITGNSYLATYGYPGDKRDETGTLSLWGMSGRSSSTLKNELLYYNMDTARGQSGSPVLDLQDRMVAVHSTGYSIGGIPQFNGGPKIRKDFTVLFNEMNR